MSQSLLLPTHVSGSLSPSLIRVTHTCFFVMERGGIARIEVVALVAGRGSDQVRERRRLAKGHEGMLNQLHGHVKKDMKENNVLYDLFRIKLQLNSFLYCSNTELMVVLTTMKTVRYHGKKNDLICLRKVKC